MTRYVDPELQRQVLADFHRLMLEALRLREQDVVRYIAILAPAMAGFFWLLLHSRYNGDIVIAGTIGTVLLLCTGAIYCATLGYNFRSIIFQIAKLRKQIGVRDYVLSRWPGSPSDFKKRYGYWCWPPEMIGVFWLSFVVFIMGVIVAAWVLVDLPCWAVIICLVIEAIAVLSPLRYGIRLRDMIDEEEEWVEPLNRNSDSADADSQQNTDS